MLDFHVVHDRITISKKIQSFEFNLSFFPPNRLRRVTNREQRIACIDMSTCGRVIFQLRKFSSIRRHIQWVSPMRRLPAEIYGMT